MSVYDILFIGHITYDWFRDYQGHTGSFYGGAELFSSYAAWAAGAKVGLCTKLGEEQRPILDLLPFRCEDVFFQKSKNSTSMLNWYQTPDKERRTLQVSSVAEPFRLEDIPPNLESKIFYLAGLIRGDFEDGMIQGLSRRGMVAADMQGFLRYLNPETHTLMFRDYEKKLQDFPYLQFLKADAAEAEVLTGLSDREEAARQICAWGAKEVMISHNSELLVCRGGQVYTCGLHPRSLNGRTGRGDTAFAVYTAERLRHGIREALAFAAAAVSLKLECPGPFKATRREVEEYMAENNFTTETGKIGKTTPSFESEA